VSYDPQDRYPRDSWDDDRDSYRPRRRDWGDDMPRKKGNSTILILAIVGGLVVVLLVCGGLGYLGIKAIVEQIEEEDKIELTHSRIDQVERAAIRFQAARKRWPANMDELIQFEGGFLSREDTLDAWGRPLILDPDRGDGTRPLIYSSGPPGKARKLTNLDW
jgi:hypothetical protein